jgi:hypothetical protein
MASKADQQHKREHQSMACHALFSLKESALNDKILVLETKCKGMETRIWEKQ